MLSVAEYLNETSSDKKTNTAEDLTSQHDPINAAILEVKNAGTERKPTDMREGVMLIFHGAPNTSKDYCHFIKFFFTVQIILYILVSTV